MYSDYGAILVFILLVVLIKFYKLMFKFFLYAGEFIAPTMFFLMYGQDTWVYKIMDVKGIPILFICFIVISIIGVFLIEKFLFLKFNNHIMIIEWLIAFFEATIFTKFLVILSDSLALTGNFDGQYYIYSIRGLDNFIFVTLVYIALGTIIRHKKLEYYISNYEMVLLINYYLTEAKTTLKDLFYFLFNIFSSSNREAKKGKVKNRDEIKDENANNLIKSKEQKEESKLFMYDIPMTKQRAIRILGLNDIFDRSELEESYFNLSKKFDKDFNLENEFFKCKANELYNAYRYLKNSLE
ncbi:MAG: hypothetical protein Q4B52_03800 [Tissierellia bacterium]|nr:hypothetical protein [Tissierellia bacterium]